jgi:4-aminobutyrate--pyruvate transaminase
MSSVTSDQYFHTREADRNFHMHPQANTQAQERDGSLVITEGQGCYFFDDKGKRYLDMHAGLWCTALGLGDTRLRDAAVRQFDRLAYSAVFGQRTTEPVAELAQRLIELAPPGMVKATFQGSGSEANDTAVKIVWSYWRAHGQPERRKIIARTKAYHGSTIVAASLTDLSHMHDSFGLPLPGFLHVPHPDCYRGKHDTETDAMYAQRLAQELEAAILKEGPESVAAFIAEPVMGAGGLYVPPAGYFPAISAVLDKYGILLIADEVICGFGRTGNWWGSETLDIRPDIITCAKALSSAYLPISAVLVNERVYDALKQESDRVGLFGHGYTYGGHPVCAAVACEALRIYKDEGLVQQAAEKGKVLEQRLRSLEGLAHVGDIRGMGLMWGVEIVRDKATKAAFEPSLKAGQNLSARCFEKGLNTRALGGHTMAFTPPLVVSVDQLDSAVNILGEALREMELAHA